MRRIIGLLLTCLLLSACTKTIIVYVPQSPVETAEAPVVSLTDSDIRAILVGQSLASYSGNCPCPYNVDAIGRQCGGRSAYSRPGGASPWCYQADVPQSIVDAYRQRYTIDQR